MLAARMTGNTERELVAAMILERPLCIICLAEWTLLDAGSVHKALADIAASTRLWIAVERCGACRTVQTTYRLSREAPPAP
jgi:hypothetical protein